LNRVDDIVLFKPLMLSEIKSIIDLLMEELRRRLAERHITVHLADAARELIAREGYDPVYGARPLRRLIQRQIETALGRKIIAGEVREGSAVEIGVENGALAFHVREPEPAHAEGVITIP
jgi:ATP-dependent Clp protease ATP-binding subunit ClpB